MYAETTVSHMTGDVESFALDAAADGAGILSSLASIITLASSRQGGFELQWRRRAHAARQRLNILQ